MKKVAKINGVRRCTVAFNTMTKKSHSSLFLLTLVTAIGLIIGGFFVPPTGVIDGSVLTAVGELFAFGALTLSAWVRRQWFRKFGID